MTLTMKRLIVPDEIKEIFRRRYIEGEEYTLLRQEYPGSAVSFPGVVLGLEQARKQNLRKLLEDKFRALTSFDQGWITGIMDGEGTICLMYSRPRDQIGVGVSVKSVTPVMQERLLALLGGCVDMYKSHDVRHRDPCEWRLTSTVEVTAFLSVFGSRLVVKKEIANLALLFCERRLKKVRSRRYLRDRLELIKDVHDYHRARQLNKRGRV
jgi:hypothetical protein